MHCDVISSNTGSNYSYTDKLLKTEVYLAFLMNKFPKMPSDFYFVKSHLTEICALTLLVCWVEVLQCVA